jgi:hypothetical protein
MLERFEALERRFWLRQSRWRFDRLPPSRRVRLEIGTDGRQLAFLLSAIHGAGYGVQLARGPMLFRELLALRRCVPLAARVDARDVGCALTLSDASQANGISVQLSYDVFSPGSSGQHMPYFMHPMIYYNGAHQAPWVPVPDEDVSRQIRIGFFGTYDPGFYSNLYKFSGLNRTQVLHEFFAKYGIEFATVPASVPVRFGVSIDNKGGDQGKKYLSQHTYLQTLRNSAFVLCLPGFCMPLSHSLIEALYCGAIPITNAHTWMHPPLRHGVEALTFETRKEFHAAIHEALAMPEPRVQAMRHAVASYYREHLEPESWWRRFVKSSATMLLVNAEELSVPLMAISG